MKTVYLSENLGKTFDTEEECLAAEKENNEKLALVKAEKEERKQAAEEVKKAFEDADAAYKAAQEKMHEFIKKYGYYHMTIKDSHLPMPSLFDFFVDPWPFLF